MQPTPGTPITDAILPAADPVRVRSIVIEHRVPTRESCMKATSHRKAMGAQTPNPYSRGYLFKSRPRSHADRDTVHSALIDIFEQKTDLKDLQRQQVSLCARLNVISRLEEVARVLPVEQETCKFPMYHVTLSSKHKVAAQSTIKKIISTAHFPLDYWAN